MHKSIAFPRPPAAIVAELLGERGGDLRILPLVERAPGKFALHGPDGLSRRRAGYPSLPTGGRRK